MRFEVVIASGGAGTRMKSIIGNIPKILAPIGQEPFLFHVLNRWNELGCGRVHLLLGIGASKVWSEVLRWKENKPECKMDVSASIEHKPLGVIGALKFAKSCLSEKFIFTYGDVYPTVAYQKLFDKLSINDDGCLAVCEKEIAGELPNILLENDRIIKYEKGNSSTNYVDVGMMVLRRNALNLLDDIDKEFLNESDLLGRLVDARKLKAYKHNAPSLQIGDPEGYTYFLDYIEMKNE